MMKCCVFLSLWLVALGHASAAKNTVLHCKGYQVGADRHPVTDQIITLDLQNNIVISIQLGAANRKDTINAPIKANKRTLQWSYPAINKVYVFNRETSRLQMLSDTLELMSLFDCATS